MIFRQILMMFRQILDCAANYTFSLGLGLIFFGLATGVLIAARALFVYLGPVWWIAAMILIFAIISAFTEQRNKHND
jgi:hypothetical protein